MKAFIVFLSICLSLSAQTPGQINVTMSMADAKTCSSLFSKSLCKNFSLWVVTAENASVDTVSLGESAVLHKIPQLRPLAFAAIQILATQGQSNSWQANLMAILAGGGTAATAITTGQIKGSTAIAKTLTSAQVASWASEFLLVEPYIANFIKGKQPPLVSNFNALAWSKPITLAPGATVTSHVFTSLWLQTPAPVTFSIDLSHVGMQKVAQ